MAASSVVAVMALVLVTVGTADASDDRVGQDVDGPVATVAAEGLSEGVTAPSGVEPFSVAETADHDFVPVIARSMVDTVSEKLRAAFELAAERVRDNPDCAALFERLGCDGIDMLSTTLYIPAHQLNEQSVCRRGAAAYTMVGASQTWVCRGFSALSLDRAAMTLVHEALHHGGLPEAPMDDDAMNAREINTMVARACGF